jgi:hypothetical protein
MRKPRTGNDDIYQLGRSRTFFPAFYALLCLACTKGAPNVAETYTATGQKAYTLDCNGQTSIACQAIAGRQCGGHGYQVVGETGDNEPHRALIFTCGLSPKEIRSNLESGIDRRCPKAEKDSHFDLATAKPVTRELAEAYEALRSADEVATAAQREIALRDAVEAIQNGKSTQEYAVAAICCSMDDVAAKYSEPGTDKDFARLMCEGDLKK